MIKKKNKEAMIVNISNKKYWTRGIWRIEIEGMLWKFEGLGTDIEKEREKN
jgi:hypothetical protein